MQKVQDYICTVDIASHILSLPEVVCEEVASNYADTSGHPRPVRAAPCGKLLPGRTLALFLKRHITSRCLIAGPFCATSDAWEPGGGTDAVLRDQQKPSLFHSGAYPDRQQASKKGFSTQGVPQ